MRKSVSRDGSVDATSANGARPLQFASAASSKRSKEANDASIGGGGAPASFVVCTTGLGSAERHHCRAVVLRLGGRFIDQFAPDCTHLVIKRAGSSPKYFEATKKGCIIVTYEFIRNCDASNAILDYRPFQAGPFLGLTICATGLRNLEDKPRLEKMVQQGGGTYDGAFRTDITTHLVVGEDGFDTEKYRMAKQQKLKLVTLQWVEACLEMGALDQEDGYQPQPPRSDSRNSTSKRDVIKSALKRSASEPATRSSTESPVNVEVKEEQAVIDRLVQEGTNRILEYTFVYIDCRHDPVRKLNLEKIARYCGASVLGSCHHEVVTHIVVISPGEPEAQTYASTIKALLQQIPTALPVTPRYLIECATQRKRLDEQPFLWTSKAPQILIDKIVCVSGYTGEDRKDVERITRELGGTFTDRLTPNVHILICKGTASEKYQKALEWKVAVHELEWLRNKLST